MSAFLASPRSAVQPPLPGPLDLDRMRAAVPVAPLLGGVLLTNGTPILLAGGGPLLLEP